MDVQASVDHALVLFSRGADADTRGDKRLAAQYYTEAVETLFPVRSILAPHSRLSGVVRDMIAFLMDRAELMLRDSQAKKTTTPPPTTPIRQPDPVKDAKRKKVMTEICTFQRNYAKSMNDMIAYYVGPMRAREVLSEDELSIVFPGCTNIAGLAEQMASDFEALLATWDPDTTTVGDVFSRYAALLRMYYAFASNFAQADNLLKERAYEKMTAMAQQCGVLDLPSLRIKPIQLVPRYVLLLHEMIKCTTPDHPDAPLLESAQKSVQAVATQINSAMKSSEREAKTLEIQSNLWTATGTVPELVAPGRYLVKEGRVGKVRSNGTVKRNFHLFCFNDLVVYATTNPIFKNRYHFHNAMNFFGAFPADDEVAAMGVQLTFGEKAFKITGESGYRIFIASTDSERRDWLTALAALTQEKEEKRRSWSKVRGELAKEDSFYGEEDRDGDEDDELTTSRKS